MPVLSLSPEKYSEPGPTAYTGTAVPEWPKEVQLTPPRRARIREAAMVRGS